MTSGTEVVVIAGTKKGLFLLHSGGGRASYRVDGPYLKGGEINHATFDSRSGTIYATLNDAWFGNRITFSSDMGATWQDNETPPRFSEESQTSVERLWHIEPGLDGQDGVLYCGLGPAALFRSGDGGRTWDEVTGLSRQPTRHLWAPGAGGLITHSVVLDPANPQRMWVAISAAGVFRSENGGDSWQTMNSSLKNILAKYEPNAEMYPEAGQCVHHLVRAAGAGDRLYAQTHWGTYRSDDGAENWTEITDGLPSDFGMAIAAHPHDPETAYVMPLEGAEFRGPPQGKLRIYRTRDAGKTWQAMTQGLPQEGAFMGMYREGMCVDSLDPAGVYFGTNTGQVYASADEGESWQRIATDLPPVSSLHAFTV